MSQLPPEPPADERRPTGARSRSLSDDLDDKLQAEIEAALGDMNLEDMLDIADHPAPPTAKPVDKMKTGTVIKIYGDDVFVEFGPKSQGVCPRSEFSEPPTVGERHDFVVDRYDAKEGLLLLSRQGAIRKAAWESLAVGQAVEARCTGYNKGGLELEIAKHRAFMPAGQIDLRHIDDLSVFVGEKMPCEIIELDRVRGRIILSRRKTLEAERVQLREKLLDELKQGDQRPAVIRSVQPYGAFADLGGVDGLIHISDICHERIKHPSDRVKEGDEVQVQILKIDRSQDPPRIGLGMKQCMADPYHAHTANLREGDTISGRITRIMPYGAFVEIAPGVEGLIHISQLSNERVNKVSSIVKPNEIVTVKVLDVDARTRRISLSLRAARAEERSEELRPEDPALRKLRAKFGGDLKGGIG
ncbi:MAG: 30S ribosomal protein S1 [Planctomycetota bacterium]|jgi:small subunit ribosomal protein S1